MLFRSLYLVQHIAGLVVLTIVPTMREGHTRTAVATLLVALAMAEVLYRWVELPMIDVGRRVITWLRARAKAAPVAPAPADTSATETVVLPPLPAYLPDSGSRGGSVGRVDPDRSRSVAR